MNVMALKWIVQRLPMGVVALRRRCTYESLAEESLVCEPLAGERILQTYF